MSTLLKPSLFYCFTTLHVAVPEADFSGVRSTIVLLFALINVAIILGLIFAFLCNGWLAQQITSIAANAVNPEDHEWYIRWLMYCGMCIFCVANTTIVFDLWVCLLLMGLVMVLATIVSTMALVFGAICNAGAAAMVSVCPFLASNVVRTALDIDTFDHRRFCICAGHVNTTSGSTCDSGWQATLSYTNTCATAERITSGGTGVAMGALLASWALSSFYGSVIANKTRFESIYQEKVDEDERQMAEKVKAQQAAPVMAMPLAPATTTTTTSVTTTTTVASIAQVAPAESAGAGPGGGDK